MILTAQSNKERGSVMIEAAIVFPLFLLLLFSMIEIGWVMHARANIAAAARDSARYLAHHHMNTTTAESRAEAYLENMGFNTEPMKFIAQDLSQNCKYPNKPVRMEIKAHQKNLSLVGDPFGLLRHWMSVKVVMHKECLRR